MFPSVCSYCFHPLKNIPLLFKKKKKSILSQKNMFRSFYDSLLKILLFTRLKRDNIILWTSALCTLVIKFCEQLFWVTKERAKHFLCNHNFKLCVDLLFLDENSKQCSSSYNCEPDSIKFSCLLKLTNDVICCCSLLIIGLHTNPSNWVIWNSMFLQAQPMHFLQICIK